MIRVSSVDGLRPAEVAETGCRHIASPPSQHQYLVNKTGTCNIPPADGERHLATSPRFRLPVGRTTQVIGPSCRSVGNQVAGRRLYAFPASDSNTAGLTAAPRPHRTRRHSKIASRGVAILKDGLVCSCPPHFFRRPYREGKRAGNYEQLYSSASDREKNANQKNNIQ